MNDSLTKAREILDKVCIHGEMLCLARNNYQKYECDCEQIITAALEAEYQRGVKDGLHQASERTV